ncbi:CHAT domain-containing protein [Aquimarina sp. AU474]|uniref:CHAT domain-containing protein n=1 Tax=Aquimarina sp. AU474 TaxID=2108529 RepID=UPI000D68DD7E|nr:CHAT domain-containing tetratricopeptide repeat protein [Aquimarina sp. AU474]
MKLVWILFILSMIFKVQGQEIDSLDIITANKLYSKGRTYRFKNLDSTCYYYKQSYQLFKKQQDWLNAIFVLKGISFSSSYHYDLNRFRKTLNSIDSVLEQRSLYFDSLNVNTSLKSRHFLEKANYYSKIRNYKRVREHGTSVIEIIESIPDSLITAKDIKLKCAAYEYIAGAYKHEGEYTKAEEIYKKSLRIISEHLDEDFALPTYRLLGDLYRKKRAYLKSNQYLRKRLDQEIKKGTASKNRIVKSCFAIADNHIQLSNSDSTQYYLTIAKQQFLDNDPLAFQYYQKLGEAYLAEGIGQKAITQFDMAIVLLTRDNSKLKRVEEARLYVLRAQAYDQIENHEMALQNYQFALAKLSIEFDSKSPIENPEPSTVQNKFEYLKVLIEKSKTLVKADKLKAALQTSKAAIHIMDELKPSFHNEEDKQFLIENFYTVFDTGLTSAYRLYQQTKDNTYIDDAFFLSEKSKSAILLGALINSRAYKFSDIPDHLLEQEQQLKASINYLQKKVAKKKNRNKWEDLLFEEKSKYSALINEFENQFPRYYNLKHNNNVVSISDFQDMIEDHTMAISYFYGKEALYILSLSKRGKELTSIPLTKNVNKQILELYSLLTNSSSKLSKLQATSKLVFDQIIHPVIDNKGYHDLIIIPDGILNYIPFESLYDGEKYVIENSTISYNNSATLLAQLRHKEINNSEVLVFAPSFSERYTRLNHSETEAKHISSYFKGTTYSGNQATLDKFTTKSSNYGILHLATHAIIDDKKPENSHLVFAPQSDDELLYINDIYTMDINASLVSLSACETGIGNLKSGEGMISLSRAFFYAGASSLANTKWQINDRSTADIMNNFYKELSKGKRKDVSLHLAKINFLKRNYDNGYRHPYYWAGLVITGDTAAIKSNTPIWVWLAGSIMLILLVVLWKKKKRKT